MRKFSIGCIGVAFAAVALLALMVGVMAGEAHKAAETKFAHWRGLREGFMDGAQVRKGLLGVPYGERCEVRGHLFRPLKETKRDREECVHVLETEHVNGKWRRESLIVVLGNEENAKRITDKLFSGQSGCFVGYETLVAVGSPEWDDNRDKASAGYSIENRFVIIDAAQNDSIFKKGNNEPVR